LFREKKEGENATKRAPPSPMLVPCYVSCWFPFSFIADFRAGSGGAASAAGISGHPSVRNQGRRGHDTFSK